MLFLLIGSVVSLGSGDFLSLADRRGNSGVVSVTGLYVDRLSIDEFLLFGWSRTELDEEGMSSGGLGISLYLISLYGFCPSIG